MDNDSLYGYAEYLSMFEEGSLQERIDLAIEIYNREQRDDDKYIVPEYVEVA